MTQSRSLACLAWRLACLHLLLNLVLPVSSQIRVLSPKSVQKALGSEGRVDGSTTTLGAPLYGDRVIGRLKWAHSKSDGCKDDYTITKDPPKSSNDDDEDADFHSSKRLIDIFIVRRGECSFATKVAVAYKKRAHAVIIFDREDSQLEKQDMKNVIVSEETFQDDVHIPSVFISYKEGVTLARSAKHKDVIVELAWEVPTNHVVKMDLWMSSAAQTSMSFLSRFAKSRKTLNQVLAFTPHYHIFGFDTDDKKKGAGQDDGLCTDSTQKYCAEDPDGSGPIRGKDVVDEDLRQLCIHDAYKKPVLQAKDVEKLEKHNTLATKIPLSYQLEIEYAQQYWDYIEKFQHVCPIEGASQRSVRTGRSFGEMCSTKLMKKVGIDYEKVDDCVRSTGQEKLSNEKEHVAWSPRALRINGWRYSGILDVELVNRAICAGFMHKPTECDTLFKKRDPFKAYRAMMSPKSGGVSFLQMFLLLLATVAVMWCSLLLYKRYLSDRMRTTLREEVMLEVQAQMGEYSKM